MRYSPSRSVSRPARKCCSSAAWRGWSCGCSESSVSHSRARAHGLRRLRADHLQHALGGVHAVVDDVPVDDAVLGTRHRQREALLRQAQRLLGLFAIVDIDHRAGHAIRLAVGIADAQCAHANPAVLAVVVPHAIVASRRPASRRPGARECPRRAAARRPDARAAMRRDRPAAAARGPAAGPAARARAPTRTPCRPRDPSPTRRRPSQPPRAHKRSSTQRSDSSARLRASMSDTDPAMRSGSPAASRTHRPRTRTQRYLVVGMAHPPLAFVRRRQAVQVRLHRRLAQRRMSSGCSSTV